MYDVDLNLDSYWLRDLLQPQRPSFNLRPTINRNLENVMLAHLFRVLGSGFTHCMLDNFWTLPQEYNL